LKAQIASQQWHPTFVLLDRTIGKPPPQDLTYYAFHPQSSRTYFSAEDSVQDNWRPAVALAAILGVLFSSCRSAVKLSTFAKRGYTGC
jgi:hypothetical protein